MKRALGVVVRALLPLALLLLLAELGLWLAGVDAPPLGDAGLAGAPLLVRDAEQPDTWHTRLFNGTRPEQTIPPRDGRRRVLLFGGSNTHYFPENVLDYALESADGAPDGDAWEVINLGREGYASQRVLRIVEQAMALRPDVVVLYCGHNEFVERVFELELARERGGLASALVGVVGRLRSARVLAAAFRSDTRAGEGDGVGATSPTGDTPRHSDPADSSVDAETARLHAAGGGAGPDASEELLATLDFDDTLAHRAAYVRNLSRMVELAREAGAQVLLCTVARNMLVPPRVYRPPQELGAEQVRELQRLRAAALDAIPERFRAHLRPYEPVWVRSWFGGHPAAPGLEPAPQRALLGAAAHAPALGGAKSASVAGAHWPDPAGWTPETFALLQTTSAVLSRAPSDTEREQLTTARALLDEGLALLPSDALLQYDRGLVGWLLGEPDAVTRIDLSIDADVGPRTTTPAQNALVRELAAELELPLLDADALFRERSPDGLIAFELLMDHCHLQPGARVLLMQDMAARIANLPR